MKGIVIVNFEPEAFIYTEVANSTKTAVCFREKKMLLFRTRAAGVKLAGLLHATLLETGFSLQPLSFNYFFFNANIELLLLPSGPRVVAVKLIHTVNDSSNRLRVAAQVGRKLGLTVNKFGRYISKSTDHLFFSKDGWSPKPPRLEGPEPTNCQSLLHCRRGEFFLHFVSIL